MGESIIIFRVSSYFLIMDITKVAFVISKIKKIVKQDNDLAQLLEKYLCIRQCNKLVCEYLITHAWLIRFRRNSTVFRKNRFRKTERRTK